MSARARTVGVDRHWERVALCKQLRQLHDVKRSKINEVSTVASEIRAIEDQLIRLAESTMGKQRTTRAA